MERSLQEHLMATNEEYRRLAAEHASYARRLDELAGRAYLSEQEQMEEIRLKKLKLRLKDQMQVILHRESSHEVA
jgi:uncharacterized protein YdcH (DUF465 family)